MKKYANLFLASAAALLMCSAATLHAQSLLQDFQGYGAGNSLPTIGWSASDIQAKIVDSSGNKVLENTIHNYNAGPVLKFVLPSGKALANYGSFTFKGYFAQGDVGYKNIIVEAYQTKPTAQFANNAGAQIGSWSRALAGSTAWENISVNIANGSGLHDTIYIAFGINCAGTGDVGATGDTTIWYADNVQLIAAPPMLSTWQDFQGYSAGDSLPTLGWSASDIQAKIVDSSGNKILQNTINNYSAAPVLKFLLPAGKTLANYGSFKFKGYFVQGDVGYKTIIVQAHQTMPTGPAFQDTLGLWNRLQLGSTAWENIAVNIANSSVLHDTIYVSFGINCAGTGNVGGTGVPTVWDADSVVLVTKVDTVPPLPPIGLSWNFASDTLGYSFPHYGWSQADVQAVVANDPLVSGHKVLKNTIHNYNAAPILPFVLPAGKTLANYGSFKFKGYFAQGDVGYKTIIVQAHKTLTTGPAFQDTLGLWTRNQLGSTNWENIVVNLSDSGSSLKDTIYIAFGINCAGTGDVGATGDTTIWYADSVTLVAKVDTTKPPPLPIVTNGDFDSSSVGDITATGTKGWLVQFASGITPPPVFEIVSDTVEHGNRAMKVKVNGLGVNQWDIQAVADSIHVTSGQTYDYSVWAKAAKAGATVNFTVGNYSYSEYAAIRPATLTTQWHQYTQRFTVTDNQTVIRAPIHFYGTPDSGNSMYIDNLQIALHVVPADTNPAYHGQPLAKGQSKFLGNAYGDVPDTTFAKYWTQVTPGNAGKWGSIAATTDSTSWNWSGLDAIYNYAITNQMIFKNHNLIWGQQQPSWISSLDSATQEKYIETWIRKVGQRYPKIDMVDVVNEPLVGHNPPDGGGSPARANYVKALGGTGATGWDWVINAFKLARKYLPNAKLLINDYGIINDNSATTSYLQIINLLKGQGLIDGIGVQGHRFELENADTSTYKSNLDRLAATGLPIYISELDLGNLNNAGTPDDNQQVQLYQKIFPVLWRHPGIKGITLWGYLEGQTWQSTCYLVRTTGSARPALFWLAQYIANNPMGVGETISGIPSNYRLEQNFPNPFNPTTNIRYTIAKTSRVSLKVFDILGREVRALVNTVQAPGQYTVTLNAQALGSGVYFYRLNAGTFNETKKLMLLK